jgi:hypothetical protein
MRAPTSLLPVTLLSLIAAMALPVTARAAGCGQGTWAGTLGGTPVSIDLDPAQDDRPAAGRYYYRASLSDLTLVPDGAAGRWRELDTKEKLTGRLQLSCDATTLSGEWRSPDGTKKLPVSARAIKDDQYNVARKAGLKATVAKTEKIGAFRYEVLSFPEAGGAGNLGVRLVGSTPGIAALNATLWTQSVDAVLEHVECVAQGRRDRGPEAGYESSQSLSVAAWNASFVVIDTHAEGYCGGAHPWHGDGYKTYRADTGAAVDVHQWILPTLRDEIPSDSRLGRLLMKAYKGEGNGAVDAECLTEVRWRGDSIHPEVGHLVFHTQASYAMTPCAEDVSLPLSAVQPFLTPAGRDALKAFR